MSRIYFIGGIHGAGKTTLCKHMGAEHGWTIYKQRHLIMDASGTDKGTEWNEIGQYHNSLITKAADSVLRELDKNRTITFDCHYAIRQDKAARLVGREAGAEYILKSHELCHESSWIR